MCECVQSVSTQNKILCYHSRLKTVHMCSVQGKSKKYGVRCFHSLQLSTSAIALQQMVAFSRIYVWDFPVEIHHINERQFPKSKNNRIFEIKNKSWLFVNHFEFVRGFLIFLNFKETCAGLVSITISHCDITLHHTSYQTFYRVSNLFIYSFINHIQFKNRRNCHSNTIIPIHFHYWYLNISKATKPFDK